MIISLVAFLLIGLGMVIFDVQPSYRKCWLNTVGGFFVLTSMVIGMFADFVPWGAGCLGLGTAMFIIGLLCPPSHEVKQ